MPPTLGLDEVRLAKLWWSDSRGYNDCGKSAMHFRLLVHSLDRMLRVHCSLGKRPTP
jgi:hypothetical protein